MRKRITAIITALALALAVNVASISTADPASAAVQGCSHANTTTMHSTGVGVGYAHWVYSNIDGTNRLWKFFPTYQIVYSAGHVGYVYKWTAGFKCNQVA